MSTKLFNSNHSILNLLNNSNLELPAESWFNIDSELVESDSILSDNVLSDYDNVSLSHTVSNTLSNSVAGSTNGSSDDLINIKSPSKSKKLKSKPKSKPKSPRKLPFNNTVPSTKTKMDQLLSESNFIMPKLQISSKIKLYKSNNLNNSNEIELYNDIINKVNLRNLVIDDELIIIINDGNYINLNQFEDIDESYQEINSRLTTSNHQSAAASASTIKQSQKFILCNDKTSYLNPKNLEKLLNLKPIFILNYSNISQLIYKLNSINYYPYSIHWFNHQFKLDNESLKRSSVNASLRNSRLINSRSHRSFNNVKLKQLNSSKYQSTYSKKSKKLIKKLKLSNLDRIDPLNFKQFLTKILSSCSNFTRNSNFKIIIIGKVLLGIIIYLNPIYSLTSISNNTSTANNGDILLINSGSGLCSGGTSDIVINDKDFIRRVNFKLMDLINFGFRNFLNWFDYLILSY